MDNMSLEKISFLKAKIEILENYKRNFVCVNGYQTHNYEILDFISRPDCDVIGYIVDMLAESSKGSLGKDFKCINIYQGELSRTKYHKLIIEEGFGKYKAIMDIVKSYNLNEDYWMDKFEFMKDDESLLMFGMKFEPDTPVGEILKHIICCDSIYMDTEEVQHMETSFLF